MTDENEPELIRHIIIAVEVPEIQVVHQAELRLTTGNSNSNNSNKEPTHAAVGHMIPAELILQHTRKWCSQRTEKQESGEHLEFAYELHVNQDLWLVGGRRRGHYTAAEGEIKRFAIMLLPQKAGHLLLPSIEIKTFVVSSAAVDGAVSTLASSSSAPSSVPVTKTNVVGAIPSGTSTPTSATTAVIASSAPWIQHQRRQIPNELDYKNLSETVLVLPDLRKTTVSLESGSPGLIGSESRTVE